jgi:RNA polymerase sigma factor (sigma-70 family)
MGGSDATVIAASIAEPVRFAAIFDRHVEPIRRFVVRRLGWARADDVVSEVFRVAFEGRSGFDAAVSSALPWLYGIAANLVRREHRGQARHLAALQRAGGRRDLPSDPLLDVAGRLDAAVDIAGLAGALLSLSDDEREMLLLIALEGLTPSEAAAVLGIPPATARTRLHRARLHIRRLCPTNEPDTETIADAH